LQKAFEEKQVNISMGAAYPLRSWLFLR
jgi:hypothetical protein